MNGQVLVNSSSNNNSVNVDLSAFRSGTYFVNIDINGRRFSDKLIIRK